MFKRVGLEIRQELFYRCSRKCSGPANCFFYGSQQNVWASKLLYVHMPLVGIRVIYSV